MADQQGPLKKELKCPVCGLPLRLARKSFIRAPSAETGLAEPDDSPTVKTVNYYRCDNGHEHQEEIT